MASLHGGPGLMNTLGAGPRGALRGDTPSHRGSPVLLQPAPSFRSCRTFNGLRRSQATGLKGPVKMQTGVCSKSLGDGVPLLRFRELNEEETRGGVSV